MVTYRRLDAWSVWIDPSEEGERTTTWLRIADDLPATDADLIAEKLIVPSHVILTDSTGIEIAKVLYPEKFEPLPQEKPQP